MNFVSYIDCTRGRLSNTLEKNFTNLHNQMRDLKQIARCDFKLFTSNVYFRKTHAIVSRNRIHPASTFVVIFTTRIREANVWVRIGQSVGICMCVCVCVCKPFRNSLACVLFRKRLRDDVGDNAGRAVSRRQFSPQACENRRDGEAWPGFSGREVFPQESLLESKWHTKGEELDRVIPETRTEMAVVWWHENPPATSDDY